MNFSSQIDDRGIRRGFSLLELIVVIGIISALIAVLIPGLRQSRDQAKAARCLSTIKEIGSAVATYANIHNEHLPPPIIDWHPSLEALKSASDAGCSLPVAYGWAELLFEHMFPNETVADVIEFEPGRWSSFPAQRNFRDKYNRAFNCPAAEEQISHGGHLRVYEPGWIPDAFGADELGRLERRTHGLWVAPTLSQLRANMPILGDANKYASTGDYEGEPLLPGCSADCPEHETSWIGIGRCVGNSDDMNQANSITDLCGSGSAHATRFAHRHDGGANYLFGDLHVERSTDLRRKLACDWDLNGVPDCRTLLSLSNSGCDPVYEGP